MSLTGVVAEQPAFKNDVSGIGSLGYDTDQFLALHHNQRTDVFFSHFRQCIKNRFIWTNCPNVPALLSKEVFYGHVAPPPPLRRAQGILSATEDTTLI